MVVLGQFKYSRLVSEPRYVENSSSETNLFNGKVTAVSANARFGKPSVGTKSGSSFGTSLIRMCPPFSRTQSAARRSASPLADAAVERAEETGLFVLVDDNSETSGGIGSRVASVELAASSAARST